MTPHDALDHAIDIMGGQNSAARLLGIPQQTINRWLRRSRCGAAAEHVLKIEKATNGVVTRQMLRPDVFIDDPAAAPVPPYERAENHADRLIKKFGGISSMARALGYPVTTVQRWGDAGSIPHRHHPAILEAAKKSHLALSVGDFLDLGDDEIRELVEAAA